MRIRSTAIALLLILSSFSPAHAEVTTDFGFVKIDTGRFTSCALDNKGRAWCWGNGDNGGLGDGGSGERLTPAITYASSGYEPGVSDVLLNKTLVDLSVGSYHACALDSDGKAYCWGSGAMGKLGNNSRQSTSFAVAVDTNGVLQNKFLTSISAGEWQTCALDIEGKAYCWGTEGYYQNDGVTVPVAIDTSGVLKDKSLVSLSTGTDSTCALDSENRVYCWYGALGKPLAGPYFTGQPPGTNLVKISVNGSQACVVNSGGWTYCWGYAFNFSEGLANLWSGEFDVSLFPASNSFDNLKSIAVGRGGTKCGIGRNDKAYCWGRNDMGQVGDNSTIERRTPAEVYGAGVLRDKKIVEVSPEENHTCAIDEGGSAYCWGHGLYGSLGNNSHASTAYPVEVKMPTAPKAPTDLVATSGDEKTTLSWSLSPDQTWDWDYLVKSIPEGHSCRPKFWERSCEITGLINDQEYSFTVAAINSVGQGDFASQLKSVIPRVSPPGIPQVTGVQASIETLVVRVAPSALGRSPTSYVATESETGKTCRIEVPANSCEIKNLDSSKEYTVTSVAINAGGQSLPSPSSPKVKPFWRIPLKPSIPLVRAGIEKLTLTVPSEPTSVPISYYKLIGSSESSTCVFSLNSKTCEITGLNASKEYSFSLIAGNDGGESDQSDFSVPVRPLSGLVGAEILGDGQQLAKNIWPTSIAKFVNTNDPTFQVSWMNKTGKLEPRALDFYAGYIEATISFVKDGNSHSCSSVFGTLTRLPSKTEAQKKIALKPRYSKGPSFCFDSQKLDPRTAMPSSGVNKSNFSKVKSITKSAKEKQLEIAARAALIRFSGTVNIRIVSYRAWPTTLSIFSGQTGKGPMIKPRVRYTTINLN